MKPCCACALRVLVLLGMLLPSEGCNGEKVVRTVEDQDTPEDVIRKVARAIKTKDRQKYLECYKYTEPQEEVLLACFEMLATSYDFRRALVGKFGPDAWNEFQTADLSPDFGANFSLATPPLDDEWQKTLQVQVEGNRATWECDWGKRPIEQYLTFDRTRDAWLVEDPDIPDSEEHLRAACAFPRAIARAVRLGLKVIAEPKATVRETKLRMAKEFFQNWQRKAQ